MKQVSFLAIAAVVLASCGGNSTETTNNTTTVTVSTGADTLRVDTTTSVVNWVGSKPTGKHTGTISLSSGYLLANDTALLGGKIVLNMNTINTTDLTGGEKTDLDNHLKDGDFFDVAKFPTAEFEIASVGTDSLGAKQLTGNLTLKGIAKQVVFPVTYSYTAGVLTAKAATTIDRSLWGVSYSGSKTPLDWVISKEVPLEIVLVAKK
ncbi:MAG: YceI family protein [Bacteroidetes bacterium]|nr:MAG: YceI family protein [Bacteroidota bacterium]TAF94147.1 MAG: YceI family protein [Bacteroidota bacterium]